MTKSPKLNRLDVQIGQRGSEVGETINELAKILQGGNITT